MVSDVLWLPKHKIAFMTKPTLTPHVSRIFDLNNDCFCCHSSFSSGSWLGVKPLKV